MDNEISDVDELESPMEASVGLDDGGRPSPVYLANWFLVAAGVVAAFVPVAEIWRIRPEYHDRFLIPLASLWLAYKLFPLIRKLPAPSRGAWLGLFAIVPGIASFDVAWFLHVQAGTPRIVVWWLLASSLIIGAGLIVWQLGWRQLRLLAFPLAFNFFCLPLPGKLHGPLESGLKEITTQISALGLPLLGIPTTRSGHVLILPSGDLGVEDACSGIRSFSALMAIACLVAYCRGLGLVRGLTLAGLTVPIVVLANGARVIVTGVLQEKVGKWMVEGWAHESLGFLVVLIGLGLILAVSQGLRSKNSVAPWERIDIASDGNSLTTAPTTPAARATEHIDETESDEYGDEGIPRESDEKYFAFSANDIRGLPVLALLVLGLTVAVLSSLFFRTEPAASVRLADLPKDVGRWSGGSLDVPDFIKEQLVFDRAVNRLYRSPTGHEVNVWIVYWSSTDFVPGPHSPDICWPSRGWQVANSGRIELVSRGAKTVVPAEFREYIRGGREQFLLFWTQENNIVLKGTYGNVEENLGDKRWIVDALLQRSTRLRPSKMFVLIGSETWGTMDYTRKEVVDFCESFIDELYKVAPESRPGIDLPARRRGGEVQPGPNSPVDQK